MWCKCGPGLARVTQLLSPQRSWKPDLPCFCKRPFAVPSLSAAPLGKKHSPDTSPLLPSHQLIWPRPVCQHFLSALPVSPGHRCLCSAGLIANRQAKTHVLGKLIPRTSNQHKALTTGTFSFRVLLLETAHTQSLSFPPRI